MFKKLLKKLNNENGSSLTITLAVIAVMSFSIVTVTNITVNLSTQTNKQVESISDEAIGKGIITQAINEFGLYLDDGGSFEAFVNDKTALETTFGITITDVTEDYPEFGDNGSSVTKVYSFGYLMSNGVTLYKEVYVSSSGSSFDTPHPFEFSIGTDGDLILNGGYYDDVSIFGNNVYLSGQAPWQEDELTYFDTSHYLTPSVPGTYPDFSSGSNDSKVYYGDTYQYCTTGCYTVTEDGSSPYVINKSLYSDVEGSILTDTGDVQEENISMFFTNFDFEAFVVEYATEILPTDNRTITDSMTLDNFETVIRNNMAQVNRNKFPSTPYTDITGYRRYEPWDDNETQSHGYVYDGDLNINRSYSMTDYDDEGLIVLGDLTIANSRSNQSSNITGTFIVTGDLHIEGYSSEFNRATFIVFGQVFIDYEYGYGPSTWSSNYDLSIIAQDNIIIDDMWENYGTATPQTVTALMYTEQSIFVDAVESKVLLRGSLFAKALGTSSNPLFMEDESGNPINGIVINSYQAYVSRGYEFNYYTWQWEKDITYVPSIYDRDYRFQIEAIPSEWFQYYFMNIPDYENVTVVDGTFTLETSEWKKAQDGVEASPVIEGPYIQLLGYETITVELTNSFIDPGVIAYDSAGNVISNTWYNTNVDVWTVGSYTVTYSAYSSYDNQQVPSVTRTVNVVDTTPPEITINGDETFYVNVGTWYSDWGAWAQDASTDNLVITTTGVDDVDVNTIGTYYITYSTVDDYGNYAEAIRTVIVR
jgi:hypothetical protein